MSDDSAITQLTPGKDDIPAIMATVGHVCLQWSLLENNILAILAAIENISSERASIIFGGMDLKPRLGTAINLAEYHKIHPPLIRRLRALRTSMDKSKLSTRRNLVVHGVHGPSEKPETFTLYVPRNKGAEQRKEMSIGDAYNLGMEIKEASDEAWSIFEGYGKWRYGEHRTEQGASEIVAAPVGRFTRIKQYLSTRADHLFRRFR